MQTLPDGMKDNALTVMLTTFGLGVAASTGATLVTDLPLPLTGAGLGALFDQVDQNIYRQLSNQVGHDLAAGTFDDSDVDFVDYMTTIASSLFGVTITPEALSTQAHDQLGLLFDDGLTSTGELATILPELQNGVVSTYAGPLGNTVYDETAYGFDIGTSFAQGSLEQETQTVEAEIQALLNDGLLISGGNYDVTSVTVNDPGFFANVNYQIGDGHQPGRSNLAAVTTRKVIATTKILSIAPTTALSIRLLE